jgi:LuxR family maltose regulon positive regulatory protein
LSLGEIARQLVLSRNTVKTQVAAIYRKLDATSRTEAVQRASDLGLLHQ